MHVVYTMEIYECRLLFTVNLKNWRVLDASYVVVDSSISAFDIVHISRDIADDLGRVHNWCLAGETSSHHTYTDNSGNQ